MMGRIKQPSKLQSRLIPAVSIGLWVACLNLPTRTLADVIWLHGRDQPIYGWVIQEDSKEVHFRVHSVSVEGAKTAQNPSSKTEEVSSNLNSGDLEQEQRAGSVRVFSRDEVRLVIVNIDGARLEKLLPPNWEAYRDYAEELSAQQIDPAARDLAIRLYLIAAKHGSHGLRESCLSGLCSLAQTDPERARWEALRKWESGLPILDPSKPVSNTSVREGGSSIEGLSGGQASVESFSRLTQDGLKLIRALRRGNDQEFFAIAKDAGFANAWKTHWERVCSLETLSRFAKQDQLTGAQLRMLLELEHHLHKSSAIQGFSPSSVSLNWESTAQAYPSYTLALPTFETVTSFDPAETIYRDGKWQRPE